jgi:glycine oxidase
MTDALIIGGGVIGLSVAHTLLEQGLRVLVIDADAPGRGASWAAAGVLAPQGAHPHAGPYLYLSLQSRDMFGVYAAQLKEETGVDIEYRTEGGLHVALDEAEALELEARHRDQEALGLPVEKLSGEDVRALEPALSPEVRCGLLFHGLHQVENRRLLKALTVAVGMKGGVFQCGAPVTRLLIKKDRIIGVAMQTEILKAGIVINAAGAWSRTLGGDDPAITPPVKPVRGQMLALDVTARPSFRHVIHSTDQYLVPRRDGRLLVGATVERVGFDTRTTAGGLSRLLTQALRMAPPLETAPVLETWAGLRPMSRDGKPILGPTGVEGLLMATGHYRNGILLAPITAKLIGDYVTTGQVSPDLKPFLLERFGGGG